MKEHLTARLDSHLKARLKEVADARSTSVSAVLTVALERYFADESILDELRGMEGRLAATMVRTLTETARVGDDVQLVIAQVDQLIRFMFQVTPEIFDKEAAAMVGSRRYSGFLESFAKEFVGRKRRAVFAAQVDDAATGEG
jgi:predicted transcriptional regulator